LQQEQEQRNSIALEVKTAIAEMEAARHQVDVANLGVKLATEEDNRIKVLDIEFSLPRPSYTSVTLAHLQEKYPDHQFSIIMGGDSFQNLHKWKNFEWIIKNYSLFVYNRPGFENSNHVNAKLTIVDAPLLEISATQIRSLIKEGKSIRYLVPDKVREEIEKGGYYRK